MYMLNTSLMLAAEDLELVGELEHEAEAPRAAKVRRSGHGLSTLTRLAHQVMALFLCRFGRRIAKSRPWISRRAGLATIVASVRAGCVGCQESQRRWMIDLLM